MAEQKRDRAHSDGELDYDSLLSRYKDAAEPEPPPPPREKKKIISTLLSDVSAPGEGKFARKRGQKAAPQQKEGENHRAGRTSPKEVAPGDSLPLPLPLPKAFQEGDQPKHRQQGGGDDQQFRQGDGERAGDGEKGPCPPGIKDLAVDPLHPVRISPRQPDQHGPKRQQAAKDSAKNLYLLFHTSFPLPSWRLLPGPMRLQHHNGDALIGAGIIPVLG